MKIKIASVILLSGLALTACQSETKETNTPAPAPTETPAPAKVTEWDFDARYLVPLNAGRADADENTVIDAANAEKTNVAELKPVWTKILADLQAGKLAAHPASENTDSENNPSTYFKRMSKSVPSGPATTKTLSDRFYARFKSHAKDGHSTHTLVGIDLNHAPGNDMPDFEFVTLLPSDLGGYMVGDKTLQAYLEAMQYESYILQLTTANKDVKVSEMTQIPGLEDKINKGDLSEL
ncbi:MAG: hypothetical protein U0176_07820 [Bacteroidia bacterium]